MTIKTVIDRAAAWNLGLARFYTGRPCRRGHDSERYVSSGACVDCTSRKPVALPELGVEFLARLVFSKAGKLPSPEESRAVAHLFHKTAPQALAVVRDWRHDGLSWQQIDWIIDNHPGGVLQVDPNV